MNMIVYTVKIVLFIFERGTQNNYIYIMQIIMNMLVSN